MGVFKVPVALRNWQNKFLPEEERGEDIQCEAIVDSGALELALPAELIERLRLEEIGEMRVRTADGTVHDYRTFGIVDLTVQGRSCPVQAIELPRGTDPILGAFPLERMDWHVSPLERKLLPNPESPDRPLIPFYCCSIPVRTPPRGRTVRSGPPSLLRSSRPSQPRLLRRSRLGGRCPP